MKLNKKQIGAAGERFAAEQLRMKGYHIQAQNWRCKQGEIDIIARNGDQWIFVEVRTRTISHTDQPMSYGFAVESIDWRKQQQLRKVAEVFIYLNKLETASLRFDVIVVDREASSGTMNYKHYEYAF